VERLVALYASTQQEVTERSFMERVYEKREQRAIALQHRTEAAAREALMRLRYESPNYGPGNRQPSGNASPDLFERHAVGHERSGKTERSKYSMEDYENEQLKMALRLSLEDGPG